MFGRVSSRLSLITIVPTPKHTWRTINYARRRTKKFEPPTRTRIFAQEGRRIYEVPFVVQKIREIDDLIAPAENIPTDDESPTKNAAENRETTKRIHVETAEGTAILFGSDSEFSQIREIEEIVGDVDRRSSPVGPIIEKMITEEINCRVALEAVKEIIAMETGETGRKNGIPASSRSEPSLSSNTPGRDRVLKQLTEMISKTRDSEMIIQGLGLLSRDRTSSPKNRYKNRLCDEVLIRVTNGEFTLRQLIETVNTISKYNDPSYREIVDALWIGIKIRESEINEKNLAALYKILLRFDGSRNIVKLILEKKLTSNWWRLTGSHMAEIMSVAREDVDGTTAMVCARKWAMLHVNTADESELFDFFNSSNKIENPEVSLEKPLAKYMGKKGLATKDPALVARIMNYCGDRRIRNPIVFDICERYLTKNAMTLPASLLAPIFVPFGFLNYRPSNGHEFWKKFERALAAKFLYLETNDALNILLSFVYLRRSPVYFVDRLFTHDFLDKLHLTNDSTSVRYLREKLRLLDAAVELESDRYACRMAAEIKTVKNVTMKARIKRIVDVIYRDLGSVVGGEDKLSKHVILGQLPTIDLYTMDLLVHSTPVDSSIFPIRGNNNFETKIAVVIHLPEHYCKNTTILIGPQSMRIRHLRKLGFQVMTLNYITLLRLRNFPEKMRDYLIDRLRIS